jgi:hypothetical protein
MIEAVFAALGLLVCVALLVRMCLPDRAQQRWDWFWRRQWLRVQGAGRWSKRQWMLLRAGPQARREAEKAIHRARGSKTEVDREGNVIRPRQFTKSDSKKPPLH